MLFLTPIVIKQSFPSKFSIPFRYPESIDLYPLWFPQNS